MVDGSDIEFSMIGDICDFCGDDGETRLLGIITRDTMGFDVDGDGASVIVVNSSVIIVPSVVSSFCDAASSESIIGFFVVVVVDVTFCVEDNGMDLVISLIVMSLAFLVVEGFVAFVVLEVVVNSSFGLLAISIASSKSASESSQINLAR